MWLHAFIQNMQKKIFYLIQDKPNREHSDWTNLFGLKEYLQMHTNPSPIYYQYEIYNNIQE